MDSKHYIARLYRRQLSEGWSDRRMAAELDVSDTYWHYLINGERQPGFEFIEKSMARFPEYDRYVLAYLRAGRPVLDCKGGRSVTAANSAG